MNFILTDEIFENMQKHEYHDIYMYIDDICIYIDICMIHNICIIHISQKILTTKYFQN